MKTIKIIDLLNKIANGEEVPKKIKDGAFELTLSRDGKHYGGQTTTVLNNVFGMERLNDEVEIIEEEKEIEKMSTVKFHGKYVDHDTALEIARKVNELIDAVNELKRDK